ncbi:hypothetical protein P43SY_001853 [Pythium insidiosum]|uniref:Serine protease family S09X n=1 Tax=Pythium insidiosum TaxID=114742 RepID=A0AAD5Q9V2_PYTIN|nr:hypothetical protein P43SY_001853 [Pythium insidiosum]
MGNDASMEFEIFAEGELEAEFQRHGGAGDVSVKKLIEKSYNDVIRSVIRPERARYDIHALGDDEFPLPRLSRHPHSGGPRSESKDADDDDDDADSRVVRRVDFEVANDRELRLRCSHWQVFADSASKTPLAMPCLVYLHSNIGSRVDALRIRDAALARGFSVLAFDFSGSGLSDGIYITMGWNESKDLHFVLQHLERDDSVTTIAFYAHSMGTFPAIVNVACRSLVASSSTKKKLESLPSHFRDVDAIDGKPIKGMILDGAYSKMTKLTEELMVAVQEEGFKVPLSLLKLACAVVQQSVKKRAEVDLELLRPVDFVDACYIPALFLTGDKDRYVASHHSDKLAARYAGPSVVMRVDGEHYSPRSPVVYDEALDFLFGAVRSVEAK